MLKSHPLTGVGYDQYTEYHYMVAHNSFVHTFAELGLIGAFIFVGMFYWYFKGLSLIPDSAEEFLPWRRALLASAVGVLTCGWFLSRQYVPIYYVMLGLGANAVNLTVLPEERSKLQTTQKDAVIILGLTLFGIAFVYFSIRTMEELSTILTSTTTTMTFLLAGIAAVSLLVGGIGIMNIMLVSVTERTREIGLRLAVGARRRDILNQFLIEATTLAAIAGAIGVVLGIGGSVIVAELARWPTLIDWEVVLAAVGFSALIGVFFGFYPAQRASVLDPIEALRHE
jgi:cell division protein FtsX